MLQHDYYALLGVHPEIGFAELRRVWRRLARRWHRTMPAMLPQPLSRISPPHTKFCPTPPPAPHMIGGEAFRQPAYPIRPPPQLPTVKLPASPSVDCAAR